MESGTQTEKQYGASAVGKQIQESSRKKDRKRQKRQQKLVIAAAVLILLGVAYLIGALYFRNHFLPRTVINGVSCGGRNVQQSTELFREKAADYVLTLKERDDRQETIAGSDISLEVHLGDSLEELMDRQNGFSWPLCLFGKDEDAAEAAVSYDSGQLHQVLDALNCMDEEQIYDSKNATLSEYQEGTGYEIVDAVFGTRINEDVFYTKLDEAITEFAEELDLAESGCYVDPVYTADSAEAQNMLETANRYVNTTITYQFGENQEVLNGSVISQWIQVGDDCTVSLNSEKEKEYISALAKKYDTKWKSRTLVTHSGETVTVPAGGNYGWRVNQDETLAALNGYLESGENYTGEVVYYQRAAQYGDPDYGNTYIEVSISDQHFWYYQNGSVILESDFVSGDPTKGHDTPKGAYRLAYKARDQVLEGQGYSSPVKYWMPFVDGVGFHDADWRDRFGGSIYKGDGSHGCLNLPPSVAKQLYDTIEDGIAILVY